MALRDDINRDWIGWMTGSAVGTCTSTDQTIRYCFRDLADASAFSRRFVTIKAAS